MCRNLMHLRGPGSYQVPEIQYRTHRQKIGQLDCVVVKSERPPQALAVLAHGFGAPGDDLVGLADDLLDSLTAQEPVEVISRLLCYR